MKETRPPTPIPGFLQMKEQVNVRQQFGEVSGEMSVSVLLVPPRWGRCDSWGASTDWKVSSSIRAQYSLHVKVSLGKTLNPNCL